MASKTKKGRSQDRKLVSGKQPHEVKHLARKTGKSAAQVRAARKSAGPSRKKVEAALKS